jgi:hypothetical protein
MCVYFFAILCIALLQKLDYHQADYRERPMQSKKHSEVRLPTGCILNKSFLMVI